VDAIAAIVVITGRKWYVKLEEKLNDARKGDVLTGAI
tara:strand:+ start:669 stop:779 length:111 start_codon:yes stop_codon:yes gene_type:complete